MERTSEVEKNNSMYIIKMQNLGKAMELPLLHKKTLNIYLQLESRLLE